MNWLSRISVLSEFDNSGWLSAGIASIGWFSTLVMIALISPWGRWLTDTVMISLTPEQVILLGTPSLLYHGVEASLQTALRIGDAKDITVESAVVAVLVTGSAFIAGTLAFNEVLIQTVTGRAALIIVGCSVLYVPNWIYKKNNEPESSSNQQHPGL